MNQFSSYLTEASSGKTLFLFDVDDTLLFDTTSMVIVKNTKTGEEHRVDTKKWAKLPHSSEYEYDLSDFRDEKTMNKALANAAYRPSVTRRLDDALRGGHDIGILTARSGQNVIRKTLLTKLKWRDSNNKLQPLTPNLLPAKRVVAVNDPRTSAFLGSDLPSHEKKAIAVQKIFRGKYGYGKIYFFDDDLKNINSVKALGDPRVHAIYVPHRE